MRIPLPDVETPRPQQAEAAAQHEAITVAHGGSSQVPVDQRADFGRLDADGQRYALGGDLAPGAPAVGTILVGDKGLYFGTSSDRIGNSDAQRYTNRTVAGTMNQLLDDREMDGTPDELIAELFRFAAAKADEAVAEYQGTSGADTATSAGVVRLFRGENGKNQAALFGAGNVTITRVRGENGETLIQPQQSIGSSAINPIAGKGRKDPGETKFHDQILFVEVQPGDRFVVTDGSLDDSALPGSGVTPAEIAKTAKSHENPNEAATAIADIPIRPEGDTSAVGLDEINVGVLDVATPTGLREKLRHMLKSGKALGKTALAMLLTKKTEAETIRATKLTEAHAEVKNKNNTVKRRLGQAALIAAGTVATVGVGFMLWRTVGGAIGDFGGHDGGVPDAGHGGHDASAAPDATHTTSPAESTAPTTSAPTPTVTETTPAGDAATSQGIGVSLGDVLSQLHDLQHDTNENAQWLQAHTGGGEVGAYDASHMPNDGTGYSGTVWHTALDSLKQLGFDPSKMSTDERGEYVQHVLTLNHLDPESAKHIGDDFVVKVPTNADAIETVMKITGHDGHPLMPTHGSPADQHMAAFGHNLGGATGADAAGTGVDRDPGVGPTTTVTTAPTTDPTTAATSDPTTAPPTSHPTTATHTSAPTTAPTTEAAPVAGSDGDHLHVPNWGLAVGATALVAVTGGMAALNIRRSRLEGSVSSRRRTSTLPPTPMVPFGSTGGIPESVARKRDAATGDPEDDDDTGDDDKKPHVRPARPAKK